MPTVTLAQYKFECQTRHHDFKEQKWDSLLFTHASGCEQLRALRATGDDLAPNLAAALAFNSEILETTMKEKWPQLYPASTRNGDKKRRVHQDELAFRIHVFDAYRDLKNFTKVAQRLRATEENVRRAYGKVYFDIFGAALPRRIKERRSAGFDPSSHMDLCEACKNAKCFEDMCPAARAYTETNSASLRESLR